MRTFAEIGLANALLATLLAVPAVLATRRCRDRPALVHALWVLVLLKLVTPPLVRLPLLRLESPPTAAVVDRPRVGSPNDTGVWSLSRPHEALLCWAS